MQMYSKLNDINNSNSCKGVKLNKNGNTLQKVYLVNTS